MKNLIILLIVFWGLTVTTFSQNVQVTAQAPNVVELGGQFRLEFTVNAEPSNFVAPEIHDFKVLYGPSQSSSSNVEIINGKVSQSMAVTFTYLLQPAKVGKYLIGPAEVTVNGKKYKSNTLNVEVVGNASGKSSSSTSQQSSASSSSSQQQQVSTDGKVFIRILTDKKNVYQGEYITATVKIYSKVNIATITNVELPTFENFFKQDIQIPPCKLAPENVNGEIYYTGVYQKFILIPQKSGNLTINPMTIDCEIQQQTQSRSRNIFDDFFGPTVQNIPVKLKSKPVTITVNPLPGNAPSTFNGAVGRFTFDAKANKTEAKTNDAITLKVVVSGNGNIKLIDAPKIQFPSDFDSYDPKITLSTSDATGGVSGSKTFEYLLIPRNPGNFSVDPVTFTYFDPASGQYKTIKSNDFNFKIEKGAGTQSGNVITGLSKEDLKFYGKDILYIKTGDFRLSKLNSYFFGSGIFYVVYIIVLLAFILIIWFRRRIIRQNANVAYVRSRRADKYATKRLKQAKMHLSANEQAKFYDELLKAIWGYLSDKLNIPLSELSRENALEALRNKGVDDTILQLFSQLMDNCEFARYAPSSPGISIQDDYNKAIDLISKLQRSLK